MVRPIRLNRLAMPCHQAAANTSFVAQILGGPIRQCRATQVKLPEAFFERFSLLKNPTTKANWWLPDRLLLQNRIAAKAENSRQGASGDRLGPTSYILSNLSLIRATFTYGKKEKSNPESIRNFVPFGAAARARFPGPVAGDRAAASTAIFREDMAEFILGLRRDFVLDQLLYFVSLRNIDTAQETGSRAVESQPSEPSRAEDSDRRYVVSIESPDEAEKVPHGGCMLDMSAEATVGEDYHFFAGHGEGGNAKRMPVHHMWTTLGKEHCNKLMDGSQAFKPGGLYVLAKRRTREVQAELWKIRGMLSGFPRAEPRPC